MDVHAPHERIHGWKDFAVHLLTITVGLLIAVGIEGLVELHREHKLVREARETLRAEIKTDTNTMKDALDSIGKERRTMANDIAMMKRIQANPNDKSAQAGAFDVTFQLKGFSDTAWKTAQATNALSYMPYDEAEKYSNVYGLQAAYEARQDVLLTDEAKVLGLLTSFGQKDITEAQAGQLLQVLGEWQSHLVFLELAAKIGYGADAAFLEGRSAPTSEHEDMKLQ